VMVLFLFGVMLTRAKLGKDIDLNNKNAAIAAPVALLLFGVLAYVLLEGFSDDKIATTTGDGAQPIDTATISDLIFKPYLLPFWGLSFVLLAAVIGAIVLARKD
jgi:NADH-quinone oxidoreductase subunit J